DILSRGAFDELLSLSPDLIEAAAQCGTKSFQMMAGAFDGRSVTAELYSYEGPFGVGYGVLSFTPGGENKGRHFLATDLSQPATQSSTADVSTQVDPYIALARKTIEQYVRTGTKLDPPTTLPTDMTEVQAGVFVTIHKAGALRGCIGTIGPTTNSIAEEIVQNAISSATRDPRFPAITDAELDDLEISVDVLGAPESIIDKTDLDPQRYGVIVTSGFRRGLLLPRLDGIDDVDNQISIALQKAGIRPNESFDMERFEVIRHE
ncbi:MAG TPA: AmmeMemoRadiSam system protein A, partial [Clostridiaceae bacterium]|nr:AmmeMemoRadiSam system protein A [Clostridiaceae bacterium]